MADYALIRDQHRNVCGLWLKRTEDAKNRNLLSMLLQKENADELLVRALAGNYRTVPNDFDCNGGCFIMFGSAKAPGEK
jgi:hypothetical protein